MNPQISGEFSIKQLDFHFEDKFRLELTRFFGTDH